MLMIGINRTKNKNIAKTLRNFVIICLFADFCVCVYCPSIISPINRCCLRILFSSIFVCVITICLPLRVCVCQWTTKSIICLVDWVILFFSLKLNDDDILMQHNWMDLYVCVFNFITLNIIDDNFFWKKIATILIAATTLSSFNKNLFV